MTAIVAETIAHDPITARPRYAPEEQAIHDRLDVVRAELEADAPVQDLAWRRDLIRRLHRASLRARALVTHGHLESPCCGHQGPHEDNGAWGEDRAFCCARCGVSFSLGEVE